MKRIAAVLGVALVISGIIGCDITVPQPATPREQAEGFLVVVTGEDYTTAVDYIHPDTVDRDLMADPAFWANSTYFDPAQGPFTLVEPVTESLEPHPDYPGSTTLTANVTNSVKPEEGYPAEFVFLPDPSGGLTPDPLIRQISIDSGGTEPETIKKLSQ